MSNIIIPIDALVFKHEDNLATTSQVIAQNTDNEHASVMKLVRDYQGQIEQFGLVRFEIAPRQKGQHGGGDVQYAILNEQQATFLLTLMRNSEVVVKFKVALVKEFYRLRNARHAFVLPDFTNPAAAARAWADQVEARQIAEAKKAEIGSRREATAMATASAAVRKVKELEIKLDQSNAYATVKRMEMQYPDRKFSWRPLKAKTLELGLQIKEVEDVNYGHVNSYPAQVWNAVYGLPVEVLHH